MLELLSTIPEESYPETAAIKLSDKSSTYVSDLFPSAKGLWGPLRLPIPRYADILYDEYGALCMCKRSVQIRTSGGLEDFKWVEIPKSYRNVHIIHIAACITVAQPAGVTSLAQVGPAGVSVGSLLGAAGYSVGSLLGGVGFSVGSLLGGVGFSVGPCWEALASPWVPCWEALRIAYVQLVYP